MFAKLKYSSPNNNNDNNNNNNDNDNDNNNNDDDNNNNNKITTFSNRKTKFEKRKTWNMQAALLAHADWWDDELAGPAVHRHGTIPGASVQTSWDPRLQRDGVCSLSMVGSHTMMDCVRCPSLYDGVCSLSHSMIRCVRRVTL
jgi:hypothetical protein